MKTLKWIIGSAILLGVIFLILIRPFPILYPDGLPFSGVVSRALYVFILSCFICLFRLWKGPTGADRIVAVDILGIMIVGLCSVLTISTGRSWYMDIGIAWALQSFISTLALSKYLEGKGFDE